MTFVSSTFYEFAVELVGELPSTSLWIYDLFTVFLIISAFCIFIIPIGLVLKKVLGV